MQRRWDTLAQLLMGEAATCRAAAIVLGSAVADALPAVLVLCPAAVAASQGGAKAYNTVPVSGWLWWAYNENSGDTGGIVMNQWQELNWEKINWMVARLGLRPWYMR